MKKRDDTDTDTDEDTDQDTDDGDDGRKVFSQLRTALLVLTLSVIVGEKAR